MKFTENRIFLSCILLFSFAPDLAYSFVLSPPRTHRQPIRQAATTEVETVATKFTGAGVAQVDMNTYNIPFEQAVEEWTANVVPASSMQEAGIFLGTNINDHFVDVLSFQFPRQPNSGLGIELLELAGGREDQVGITIVEGLVEGGCAENSGILPGDSLVQVGIVRSATTEDADNNKGGLTEATEEFSVDTECRNYDSTVDGIIGLPPCETENEMFKVTVKRLRRKPKVSVTLQYPPESGDDDIKLELFAGENLRRNLLVRGVKLNDALQKRFDSGGSGDCGAEGTCATCAVAVVKGIDLISPPKQQEAQIFRDRPTWRMSCRTVVGYGMKEGDVTIRVNPKQWPQ